MKHHDPARRDSGPRILTRIVSLRQYALLGIIAVAALGLIIVSLRQGQAGAVDTGYKAIIEQSLWRSPRLPGMGHDTVIARNGNRALPRFILAVDRSPSQWQVLHIDSNCMRFSGLLSAPRAVHADAGQAWDFGPLPAAQTCATTFTFVERQLPASVPAWHAYADLRFDMPDWADTSREVSLVVRAGRNSAPPA